MLSTYLRDFDSTIQENLYKAMETMFLPHRCYTSTLLESKLCFLLLKTLAQPQSCRFVIKRVCLDDTKLKVSGLQGLLREVCLLYVYFVFQIFP